MKLITTSILLLVIVSLASAKDSEKSSDNSTVSKDAPKIEERKFRYEQDKKEVASFLNTKNILKTVVKLLFGTAEESTATSRQVLNVLVKVSVDAVSNMYQKRIKSISKVYQKYITCIKHVRDI